MQQYTLDIMKFTIDFEQFTDCSSLRLFKSLLALHDCLAYRSNNDKHTCWSFKLKFCIKCAPKPMASWASLVEQEI